MKKSVYFIICICVICLSAYALILANWKVKGDEYSVKFTNNGSIHGEFKGLKADIQFDKLHPEQGKISASIDATSIASGFFLKNSHAKDALATDKYPTISFVSTAITKNVNAFQATGKLTMRGVTKQTVINFTFEDKVNEGIFKGNFKVIPKDFGINKDGTPDYIEINLVVPVTK
jgi:polyisoprenoid-binding protein YceI